EQKADRGSFRALRGEVHGQQATERRDEEEPAPLIGDVTSEVRTKGEERGGDGDETHRLADQGPFLVTPHPRLADCSARFHGGSFAPFSVGPRIWVAAWRSFSPPSRCALPENPL